jgi:hypothetical protein
MKVSIALRSTNFKHEFHLNNIKEFTSYSTENTLRLHYGSKRLRLFREIISIVMIIVRNTRTPWDMSVMLQRGAQNIIHTSTTEYLLK